MEPHEHVQKRRVRVVFTRKMEERKLFMEELKSRRTEKTKRMFREIKKSIGPRWYQALSTPQRMALDTLKSSMVQDMLEARPTRTSKIMRTIGLQPKPSKIDLLTALYYGNSDPKDMLAQLYQMLFGYHFSAKRASYNLNQRLILSSIFYLGHDNLIVLLRERYKPDAPPPPPSPPKKKKPPPIPESPYLQRLVAFQRWTPKVHKPKPVPPLPSNLDDLNEPYEDEPIMPKPPPPPPPPPPPKKRLPESYCEKLADYYKIEAYQEKPKLPAIQKRETVSRRIRASKFLLNEGKKTYGLGFACRKREKRRKPKLPHTSQDNAQYNIKGVYVLNGRPRFILEPIVVISPDGELIHGGHALVNGEYLTIHKGYTARPTPPPPPPCDCLEKFGESVFQYVKTTKCYCGHYYDYGNEGEYDISEPQYFTRPTIKGAPMNFDYSLIFDTDPKSLTIRRAVKKAWDTDSILWEDDGITPNPKEKRKKKLRKSSKTCLGDKPTISNYLKCALRYFREINIAARLPDVHLTQELQEWMRRRLYGPFTPEQRKKLLLKSTYHWAFLKTFPSHVTPSKDPMFAGETTWAFKHEMNKKFKKYTHEYKIRMYRTHAYINNLLWSTMCHPQFPDKHFREIFFSYLVSRIGDLQLMHPYDSTEANDRRTSILNRPYFCPPEGWEPDFG